MGETTIRQPQAKFWLQVLTELRNRGLQDIFIACVDGPERFSESDRGGVSPHGGAIMHRASGAASLNYVPWKARKPVAADLQSIYRAGTVTEAEQLVPCVADGRVLTALGFWRILVEAADEV